MDSPDISADAEDTTLESVSKRLKRPSPKMLNSDEQAELLKMVLSDELEVFQGETIQGYPDTWGIMLPTARGKDSVQLKCIEYLKKYSNLFTHKNFNSRDCLQVDKRRLCQLFHDSGARHACRGSD